MITVSRQTRQQMRQNLRIQQKTLNSLKIAEIQLSSRIKNLLAEVFSEDALNEIAIDTQFLLRSRKLTPFAIVAILLMGCYGTEDVSSLEIMCSFLRKHFNIFMLPQSLQEKINSKSCADFIKAVAIRVMTHEANKIIAKIKKKKNKSWLFCRILLQDSTVISLPEAVSRIFRGCGGSASKAAVKCDIIINQVNHMILRCRCLSGRIPDSSLSEDILDFAEEGDLVIRDMGYFNLSHFSKMIQKKVQFISRLRINITVYLNKTDKDPIDIIEHLKKLKITKSKIDIDVYLGQKERVPVRLIGIKVPKEVVGIKSDHFIKAHGRKKNPSEEQLKWYEYTLMVTNICRKSLSLRGVMRLYKIRWQIELFFKNMKSQLKVDNFTGENKYRILCLLYSKLVVTWIAALLFALAQGIAQKKYIISPVKFTKWLRDVEGWQRTIMAKDFTELIESFRRDMNLLRKTEKRKDSWVYQR